MIGVVRLIDSRLPAGTKPPKSLVMIAMQPTTKSLVGTRVIGLFLPVPAPGSTVYYPSSLSYALNAVMEEQLVTSFEKALATTCTR
jgi:hypothetical protein